MKNLIGKKTVNQIKVGDLVGVTKGSEDSPASFLYSGTVSGRNDHSIVTVILVCKVQFFNTDGQKVGFVYKMICSDGNAYNIGNGGRKFLIFNGANAQ